MARDVRERLAEKVCAVVGGEEEDEEEEDALLGLDEDPPFLELLRACAVGPTAGSEWPASGPFAAGEEDGGGDGFLLLPAIPCGPCIYRHMGGGWYVDGLIHADGNSSRACSLPKMGPPFAANAKSEVKALLRSGEPSLKTMHRPDGRRIFGKIACKGQR